MISVLFRFIGPQEKDFGLLYNRCQVLTKHVASVKHISTIFGLCAALDNLNDFLGLFVQRGDIDSRYENPQFLEEHPFFHSVSILDSKNSKLTQSMINRSPGPDPTSNRQKGLSPERLRFLELG